MSLTRRRADSASQPTLDDFTITEVMSFLSGWRPPDTEPDPVWERWADWPEFISDYQTIRAELIARFRPHGPEPFAERALRVRKCYGLEALRDRRYLDHGGTP